MTETSIDKTKKFFIDSLNEIKISNERELLLKEIAQYIANEKNHINLNFICTHNSRRSQLSQVWADYAISFYNIKNVNSFSGGTEVTAFHKNTVKTLQSAGFKFVLKEFSHENPVYKISYKNMQEPIIGFSKIYDNHINKTPFVALTTCSSAAENCPFIPDAIQRFHLPFIDPKFSDLTPQMDEEYLKTNKQIAAEMNYVFLHVSDMI